MKLYRNKFLSLLAVVSVAVFASCQKDPAPEPPTPPKPPVEGEGMISLSLSLGGSFGTKIAIGDSEYPGTIDERYIDHLLMVLYGAEDDIVKYQFKLYIHSNWYEGEPYFIDGGGEEEPYLYQSVDMSRFITYARKVDKADYKMLIIANPVEYNDWSYDPLGILSLETHDLYEITKVGQPLSAFEKPFETVPDYLRDRYMCGIAQDQYFLMTNAQGLIYVAAEDLGSSINDAHARPIPVTIDRVVSKALVDYGDNFKVLPLGAMAYEFKWGLDLTNKKSYWMRKMTHLVDGSGGPYQMEVLNSDRRKWYAEDPNFLGFSGRPVAELKEEFSFYDENETPELTIAFGDGDYCLENTMAESDQHSDVITKAVISCVYHPNGLGNFGQGYYIFAGTPVTYNQMKLYANGINAIPDPLTGLDQAINQAKAEGINFDAVSASFSVGGLRYYHGGINYYVVPIKHYSYNDFETDRYGEYGMIRNALYQVHVQAVKGPGSPTITEESDEGNLAFEIEILGWQNRDQEHEL